MVLMNHPHKLINSIKKTQPNKIVNFYEKLEYILIYNLFNYIINKINCYKNSITQKLQLFYYQIASFVSISLVSQQQNVLQILKIIPVNSVLVSLIEQYCSCYCYCRRKPLVSNLAISWYKYLALV